MKAPHPVPGTQWVFTMWDDENEDEAEQRDTAETVYALQNNDKPVPFGRLPGGGTV